MIENEMNESDLVPEALGCPCCKERRMDFLSIDDDNQIHCLTCGITFNGDEWARGQQEIIDQAASSRGQEFAAANRQLIIDQARDIGNI